jgi:hypothetical protein
MVMLVLGVIRWHFKLVLKHQKDTLDLAISKTKAWFEEHQHIKACFNVAVL